MTEPPAPLPPAPGDPDKVAPSTGQSHFLVQAPVAPMDADGLNVTLTGTAAFAIASALAALFYAELSARGDGWWLGVCISGFVLGLVGLLYCAYRRRRRRAGLWTKD